METTKLSSKGQATLPRSVRDAQGWPSGTEFAVEATKGGCPAPAVETLQTHILQDAFESTGYTGKAKSLADMEKAIARGVEERNARGRYYWVEL
jgi:bifunctional DNA-binding transcriptional regulator/antitoxin component of YhaV-PrlF toxin-antitoxin module